MINFKYIWLTIIITFVIAMIYTVTWSNDEYEKNTWYQNAVIVEKSPSQIWGDYCLLEADDGKRYHEYCRLYLVGDIVELEMQKTWSTYITKKVK